MFVRPKLSSKTGPRVELLWFQAAKSSLTSLKTSILQYLESALLCGNIDRCPTDPTVVPVTSKYLIHCKGPNVIFCFSFGSIFVEDRRAGIEGVLAGLKIQTNFSQINDASYKHTYYPDYNYSPKDRSPPKSILGFWNSCADLKFQLNILNS